MPDVQQGYADRPCQHPFAERFPEIAGSADIQDAAVTLSFDDGRDDVGESLETFRAKAVGRGMWLQTAEQVRRH
jgi:hypothetical protein